MTIEKKEMLGGLSIEAMKGVIVLGSLGMAIHATLAFLGLIQNGYEGDLVLLIVVIAIFIITLMAFLERYGNESQWAIYVYSVWPFRARFIPVGDHIKVRWPLVRGWQAIVGVGTIAMICWYGEMALFAVLPTWLAAAVNCVSWSVVGIGVYAWYRQWRLNRGVQRSPEQTECSLTGPAVDG